MKTGRLNEMKFDAFYGQQGFKHRSTTLFFSNPDENNILIWLIK